MTESKTYICDCGATFESERVQTPPGWLYIKGKLVCSDCASISPALLDAPIAVLKDLSDISSAILLRSGVYLDLADPDCTTIQPIDIASGLRQPRFAAQTPSLYTIAQHSLLVLELVEPIAAGLGAAEGAMLRRCALLHDAPEAFIHDITRPLKNQLPDYRAIEREFEDRFAWAYGIEWNADRRQIVKYADLQALAVERRDLLDCADPWPCLDSINVHTLANTKIARCWGPDEAEERFLVAMANLELAPLEPAA